jgi:hypothetical protein
MTEREAIDLLWRFEKAVRERTAFPTSKSAKKTYDDVYTEMKNALLREIRIESPTEALWRL